MLTQRVQQRVVDHADWLYQHAPTVAQRLPELVQMATSVITTGGRLWCLGDGPAAALAMYGADILRHGLSATGPDWRCKPCRHRVAMARVWPQPYAPCWAAKT